MLFLPTDLSDKITDIQSYLQANQIQAATYQQLSPQILNEFVNKKIQVLIGISSYRNPLARGLDLPQAVKYAIFWGVPKLIFKINENFSRPAALAILWSLQRVLPASLKQSFEWEKHFLNFIKILKTSPDVPDQIQSYLKKILKNPQVEQLLKSSPEIIFDGTHFVIGDIA